MGPRRKFLLATGGVLSLAAFGSAKLCSKFMTTKLDLTDKSDKQNATLAPSLFIGHGSPMNAIAHNDFTDHLKLLGDNLQNIKGLIVISAHWITPGVEITSHQINPLVYDFSGFPDELYKLTFESHGSPQLSQEIASTIQKETVKITDQWGLDHGAWTVLKHMYPTPTQFPIFQLSMNRNWNLAQHFEFAKSLIHFRKQGFAILGSGNIVHNLRQISWEEIAKTPDWALEFDQFVTDSIDQRNFQALINPQADKVSLWKQAHPSIDHYLPLLYSAAVSLPSDKLEYPFIGFQNGSLSMRSVKFS